ncbi:MAG: glycosyltransferase [Bryobacteraceae bacterium]|nr:glycosyltransferase [Bryobacteraceae bacterium]
MSAAPLVSVIIPCYRAAAYIGETLASALAQTFTDREIVLVNDGSPDTPELERALEPYRHQIRYLVQENQGPSAARNFAIREAAGTWLAFLDSDDLWEPRYLETQMAALARDPSLDLIYGNAILFGDTPDAGRALMDVVPSEGPVTAESLIRQQCIVLTPATVARRAKVIEAGLFDPALRTAEDMDLWIRMAKAHGRLHYHRETLVRYRRHAHNLTSDELRIFVNLDYVLRKTGSRADLTDSERQAIADRLRFSQAHQDLITGKLLLADGDYPLARQRLRAANTYFRSLKLTLVHLGLGVAPGLVAGLQRRRDRSH